MSRQLYSGVLLLVVMTTCHLTRGQDDSGPPNLFKNPSFEGDLKGSWTTNGFNMDRVTDDVYEGTFAIRCTGRATDNSGPIQLKVPIKKGRRYAFEGYIKQLNNKPIKIWQSFKAVLQMTLAGQARKQSYIIAYRGFMTADNQWHRINGSIDAPELDIKDASFFIRGPDKVINFLVDNLSLKELPENPNWRAEADRNIEKYRKSNVNLRINLPSGRDNKKNKFRVEVALKKHLFVFGAKIEEYELVEEPMNFYTKLVYNWFNWATVQAYKWKFNKGGRYDRDFSRATNATRALLENGLDVRAHSIFWNLEKNVPEWVLALPDQDLIPELARHVNYMMDLTRGKVKQIDVQNEHIHGKYYEERLQNPDITKLAFRWAKASNPDPDAPKLYFNDFTCVTSGANTEDMYDLAVEYTKESVPVEGLGCQGHTKDFVRPNPTSMWDRLDRLGSTGLDIMMSEFDLGWPDIIQRADWLEDAWRAFFGHPKLVGLIMWGFWNQSMRYPDHDLVRGPTPNDIKILETGERWACITQKEWTTKKTIDTLKQSTEVFPMRGFQGDYDVTVYYDDVPVQIEHFTLGKGDMSINIDVTSSKVRQEVPQVDDFVPQCISHRAERTLGTEVSSSSESQLKCRYVMSSWSRRTENEAVSVACRPEEIMTSCSSYQRNSKWQRNGEKIEVQESGEVQCVAYNGRDSVAVRSQARCCQLSGLTCQYRAAGPSYPFHGAMSEARCTPGQLALGCSIYQRYPNMVGVKPATDFSSCIATSGAPTFTDPGERSGAEVSTACCTAPQGQELECVVKVSKKTKQSPKSRRSIACDDGYTLTGCNGYDENGRSSGTRIISTRRGLDKCLVKNGARLPQGTPGAVAIATCCRIKS